MSDTGRYYVKQGGRTFVVEPLTPRNKKSWGDLNPATGKVEGSYGTKHTGSIDPASSIITEDTCKNIKVLGVGESPMSYIEKLLKE
jgi:hypothetical protein